MTLRDDIMILTERAIELERDRDAWRNLANDLFAVGYGKTPLGPTHTEWAVLRGGFAGDLDIEGPFPYRAAAERRAEPGDEILTRKVTLWLPPKGES